MKTPTSVPQMRASIPDLPRCPAGRPLCQGLTLLEILAVVAVMALVVSVTLSRQPQAEAESDAAQLRRQWLTASLQAQRQGGAVISVESWAMPLVDLTGEPVTRLRFDDRGRSADVFTIADTEGMVLSGVTGALLPWRKIGGIP